MNTRAGRSGGALAALIPVPTIGRKVTGGRARAAKQVVAAVVPPQVGGGRKRKTVTVVPIEKPKKLKVAKKMQKKVVTTNVEDQLEDVGLGNDSPPDLPAIEDYLVDVVSFKDRLIESGHFVYGHVALGNILVVFSMVGDVLGFYQHTEVCLSRVMLQQGDDVSGFPEITSLPVVLAAPDYLLLSKIGVQTLLERFGRDAFHGNVTWPRKSDLVAAVVVEPKDFNDIFGIPPLDFDSSGLKKRVVSQERVWGKKKKSKKKRVSSVVFDIASDDSDSGVDVTEPLAEVLKKKKKKKSVVIDVDEDDDDSVQEESSPAGGFFMRDLSTMSPSNQAKFYASRAFRVLCGNDEALWRDMAGPTCSVDTRSTFTNVLVMMSSSSLTGLPILSNPILLGALLVCQFSQVKFAVSFVSSTVKKDDGVHLGFLLFPQESFKGVYMIRVAIERLVTIFGLMFRNMVMWKRVFESLLDLLSTMSEHGMSRWSPAYVFKIVSLKLFRLGWFLNAESTGLLSKRALQDPLVELMEFDMLAESSEYILSNECRMYAIGKVSSGQAGGAKLVGSVRAGPDFPKVGTKVVIPVSEQWCLSHVGKALGVRDKCSLSPCPRVHPKVSLPLTESVKVKLKTMGDFLKEGDYKRKFLAAIV